MGRLGAENLLKKKVAALIAILVSMNFIVLFQFGTVSAISDPNYTVPDVEAQFLGLKHHGEALGFYLDPDAPEPSESKHFQGIQRLPGPGIPTFFVSQSVGGEPGCLNVVQMGSRDWLGERLRSNRFLEGYDTDDTGPAYVDKVVEVFRFDGISAPAYEHPGGLQLLGDVLAVPLSNPHEDDSLPKGMIVLLDVSNPTSPVTIYQKGVGDYDAGEVAITQIVVGDGYGKFLMLVTGHHNKEILIFESNIVEDLHDPNLEFTYIYTWERWDQPELAGIWPVGGSIPGDPARGYQSINFVRQSDGKLYLIGTSNSAALNIGGEDWAELYLVSYVDGELELTFRGTKHFYCNYQYTGRVGNFRASAGIYISPSGELILYSTEHEASGPLGSVQMGEFRHEEAYRPGSPLRAPTADIGGPYVVECDSSITLSGSAYPPIAKPWVELFEHPDYEGRSLVFDWLDRDKEYLNEFDEHDGFTDKASSVRWEAPSGCLIVLYEHDDYNRREDGKEILLWGNGEVQTISDLDSRDFDDKCSSIRFFGSQCESPDLFYQWDLDGDVIFETPGKDAEFGGSLIDVWDFSAYIRFKVQGPYGESGLDATSVSIVHEVNPELTSPTHSKGHVSSNQVLTVEWETPCVHGRIEGYSYVLVTPDDPYWTETRIPDDIIDLGPSTTSFTTPPLEPGYEWEFNIKSISSGGTPARFYSSFWVQIESTFVNMLQPQSGDSFEVGEWMNIYWEPISWGGLDVTGGYRVDSINLLKNSEYVTTLLSNQLNFLHAGFPVPDVESGSDYQIELILDFQHTDTFPEYPETYIGLSDFFTITTPISSEIVTDIPASDSMGSFSLTIDAGTDKGAPITSWTEVSTTNIESYTVELVDDYTLEINGQLEDPTQIGQIVLDVDPVGIIIRYEVNIVPFPTPPSPVAVFTEDKHVAKVNEVITFDPSRSYHPEGEIFLFSWDWESDGDYDEWSLSPSLVTHSYDAPRTYTVTLRVTDYDGYTDTTSATKTITDCDIIMPDLLLGLAVSVSILLCAYLVFKKRITKKQTN